ncbi:hypothetical protein ACQ4WX_06420 [Streptomyces lasalocidi]
MTVDTDSGRINRDQRPPLDDTDVRAAVEEAGYGLIEPTPWDTHALY